LEWIPNGAHPISELGEKAGPFLPKIILDPSEQALDLVQKDLLKG
jgi:hypothetical protein